MSTRAESVSSSLPVAAESENTAASKALIVGGVGIALTAAGLFVSGGGKVAFSWLVGMTFWCGIALGMLFLVMIHHIFDASWSVLLRRQFEHGLAAFKWLLVLFVPLLVSVFMFPGAVWKWMNPKFDLSAVGGHGTVGDDILWVKKSALLNPTMFLAITIGSFLIWWWLSERLRGASFAQDNDGDLKWTYKNRKTSAFGLPLAALSLTLCIVLWVKSLDYHWFSTMYGVWYFAGCARAALSVGLLIMVWLWNRGDYKGILNHNHFHSIGQLMFAFTVFWAYVTFSQYFLIWNANVPEETFWYNLREINSATGLANQWKWVGMLLLFGHFVVPFLALLSYKRKLSKTEMPWVAIWIALIFLLDLIYNIWPSKKDIHGDALPLLQLHQVWTLTAVIGIGGVCVWAYLKSFSTTKLIPIRDPRIAECLTYHESTAD
ncbi:MAG: hypothetical protein U1F61_20620 [Opitutaceae bacterium]